MKELSSVKKIKVIQLFLTGQTYDEIALEAGISKGSVVNIVNEFREGILPIPTGMVEFVDEVRKLVVDLKKHDTTVIHLKGYMKLHAKLKEMGVTSDQVETWLDICQTIATPSVSGKQLVQSAIELAKQTGKSGLSYQEAIDDYQDKLDNLNLLNEGINQKTEKLNQVKSKIKEIKNKASEEIKVIFKKKKAVEEDFLKKKTELESDFEKLLVEHNLNREKIVIVNAMLEQDYSQAKLSKDDISGIVKDILKAGGLKSYIKQLEDKASGLEARIAKLKEQKVELQTSVDNFGKANNKLLASFTENAKKEKELTQTAKVRGEKLADIEEKIAANEELVETCRFILKTLLNPESLSNDELERLTKLIFFVRQLRIGIDPKRVSYVEDNMIYECQVPRWYLYRCEQGINIKNVQQNLALCLIPGVADRFMPRFEHDFKEIMAKVLQLEKSFYEIKGPTGKV